MKEFYTLSLMWDENSTVLAMDSPYARSQDWNFRLFSVEKEALDNASHFQEAFELIWSASGNHQALMDSTVVENFIWVHLPELAKRIFRLQPPLPRKKGARDLARLARRYDEIANLSSVCLLLTEVSPGEACLRAKAFTPSE